MVGMEFGASVIIGWAVESDSVQDPVQPCSWGPGRVWIELQAISTTLSGMPHTTGARSLIPWSNPDPKKRRLQKTLEASTLQHPNCFLLQ